MHTSRHIAFAVILLSASAIVPVWAQPASAPTSSSEAPASGAIQQHGSKAADKALAKRVRRALAKSPGMILTDVNIRAKDGIVTLKGSVPVAALVNQAAEVAASVNGVSSVSNHLTVRVDPRRFNGQ